MGDINLTLCILGLPGGGVLGVIAGSVAVGAAGPVEGDIDVDDLGGVACGGVGAAGTEAGIADGEDLGGETGGIKEHEVLSGDWTLGLARLGLGDAGGDQEPRTGVAAAAAPGPAVMATTAAAVGGDSLLVIVGPQKLKVSKKVKYHQCIELDAAINKPIMNGLYLS